MFKAIGHFVHRTPWWALVVSGIGFLVAMGVFMTPFQLLSLHEQGVDRAEKRAIERVIEGSIGMSVLQVARTVVQTVYDASEDSERRAQLSRALEEIRRAEIELEQESQRASADLSTLPSQQIAREIAVEVALAELEAAIEAREQELEARADLIEALTRNRVSKSDWPVSIDERLEKARRAEEKARRALERARSLTAAQTPPKLARTPALPQVKAPEPPQGSTDTTSPPETRAPAEGLSSERRQEIKDKAASAVYRASAGALLIALFIPFFLVVLIAKYFIGRSRRAHDIAEQKEREAQEHNIHRQLTEAKLKALQAQVEPHFLFNTLANVQALTEVDPAAANEMTGHLIEYLRASLPRMRRHTSTVAQEIELVVAYLKILEMRFGSRLTFSVEVQEQTRHASFPPMMLPSLVENAVQHGIEPLRDGGRVDIVASLVDQQLVVSVSDTGCGLSAGADTGSGVGLTNIRQRLEALFGDEASLTIAQRSDSGVVATIRMPFSLDDSGQKPSDQPGVQAQASSKAAASAAKPSGATKVLSVASKGHRVWWKAVSTALMALLMTLAVAFVLIWAGLMMGLIPVTIDDMELRPLEGMALGTLVLVIAFGVLALAVFVVVGVIYGLGLLLTLLSVIVPVVIAVGLFPGLPPFILIGIMIYLYVRRRRRLAQEASKQAGASHEA